MSYIQTHTAIPVPTVYIHDDDLDGTVGGAWMVMDYVSLISSLLFILDRVFACTDTASNT